MIWNVPSANDAARLGVEADFGPEHAETFRRDLHTDPSSDYRDRDLPTLK